MTNRKMLHFCAEQRLDNNGPVRELLLFPILGLLDDTLVSAGAQSRAF